MHTTTDIFAIDQIGETIIVAPLMDLRELVYQQIEARMSDL